MWRATPVPKRYMHCNIIHDDVVQGLSERCLIKRMGGMHNRGRQAQRACYWRAETRKRRSEEKSKDNINNGNQVAIIPDLFFERWILEQRHTRAPLALYVPYLKLAHELNSRPLITYLKPCQSPHISKGTSQSAYMLI